VGPKQGLKQTRGEGNRTRLPTQRIAVSIEDEKQVRWTIGTMERRDIVREGRARRQTLTESTTTNTVTTIITMSVGIVGAITKQGKIIGAEDLTGCHLLIH